MFLLASAEKHLSPSKGWRIATGLLSIVILSVWLVISQGCSVPKFLNMEPAEYVITDLGNLARRDTHAMKINDSGAVVGYSLADKQNRRAYLWTEGEMQDLRTLGGDHSEAWDVNQANQVAGFAETDREYTHAFRWTKFRRMQDLGTLEGGFESRAYGINDAGHICGWSETEGGDGRAAFVWSASAGMRALPGLSGKVSEARDINREGWIVGFSEISADIQRACLWLPGSETAEDLGTLGGENSKAFAVNNEGQVVGTAQNDQGHYRAFIWDRTKGMREIGVLPRGQQSYAYDINDQGTVVGWSDTASDILQKFIKNRLVSVDDSFGTETARSYCHGFVWDGKEIFNIHELVRTTTGWDVLTQATGINNKGQISGIGYVEGQAHGFLLTPYEMQVEEQNLTD